jgi:phosphoglycolate phosphatase-like HAD superfamily hydrolase
MMDLHINPTKKYVVCIDSDGCVFDNMELKHKECFCPATVNVWNLQGVSRYVRESAEYVNLYSGMRGANRFPALVETLNLTFGHPEVIKRGFKKPDLEPLIEWIKSTKELSAKGLEKYIQNESFVDPILNKAYAWSKEVDRNIEHIVRNVIPFPYVSDTLKRIKALCDVVIVSATPYDAIVREWKEHGLLDYVTLVTGQEHGTKAHIIEMLTRNYQPDHMLMVGDAPGDFQASKVNNVAFYPIVPMQESQSWKDLYDKVFISFVSGTYKEQWMQEKVNAFFSVLK